ncbi:MAG: hypothetical protein SNJ72_03925 [Fimbriimonadales bacterium]
MTLREFVKQQMQSLYEALQKRQAPPVGTYDADTLRECFRRAQVQTGTTQYFPDRIVFEFIFTEPSLGPVVLSITVTAPEPIVYMPVPDWVIEDVWQGDVTGSFRFRSEAEALLERFRSQLFSEENLAYFERHRLPKRRD